MNCRAIKISIDSRAFPPALVCLGAALVLLLCLPAPAGAWVYYVDAGRPGDGGDGLSWETAKRTIQGAIDDSIPGDTIIVKYGEYVITESIVIDSNRKIISDDGTHDSWETAVPDHTQCIISSTGTSRVLTITGPAVTYGTILTGLRMTGGRATNESVGIAKGGGIYIAGGATPYLDHCSILDNIASTTAVGYGGGIACVDAGTQPVIMSCWIKSNKGSTANFGNGGGVSAAAGGFCRVESCSISDNIASTANLGYGGGIYFDECDGLIMGNWIENNVAGGPSSSTGGRGGGIYVSNGAVDIFYNDINHNHAAEGPTKMGYGGGVYTVGIAGAIKVRDNYSISHNIASTGGIGNGGGICCASSNTQIYGNAIDSNIASSSMASNEYYRTGKGGGISNSSHSGNIITDNVLVGNKASRFGDGTGGGIYFATTQTITNNIFAYNIGSEAGNGSGGGVWFYNTVSSVLANNVFYRNANKTGAMGTGTGSAIHFDAGGSPAIENNIFLAHDVAGSDSMAIYCALAKTISYNCFYKNPGGDYNANVTSNYEVAADPRLIDPENGDYALYFDSPCIEAGNPAYAVPLNGGWVVDIGAIEYKGERHERAVTGTGELLFGGRVKAKVNVTTLGTLSKILMTVHPDGFHPMAPTSVARWFEIDHTGSGMTFDLTMTYYDAELRGRDEASLVVWRWTDSGWDGPKAVSAADTDANWLTVSGETGFSDWIMTDAYGPTDAGDVPAAFALSPNYPNPFNPATVIEYTLSGPSNVRLSVYDAAGRLVRVLLDAHRPAGGHSAIWDGRNEAGGAAASGIYFCRLEAGAFTQTRKLVLLR